MYVMVDNSSSRLGAWLWWHTYWPAASVQTTPVRTGLPFVSYSSGTVPSSWSGQMANLPVSWKVCLSRQWFLGNLSSPHRNSGCSSLSSYRFFASSWRRISIVPLSVSASVCQIEKLALQRTWRSSLHHSVLGSPSLDRDGVVVVDLPRPGGSHLRLVWGTTGRIWW